MIRGATSDVCQLLCRAEVRIELIALGLGAVVLPVGGEFVSEGVRELLEQRLAAIEILEGGLGALVPEHAAVLLARAADASYFLHGAALLLEPVEHELERVEPHSHRRVHLALGLVGLHPLLDAILGGEIGVEVNLGFGYDGEVRFDYDGCLMRFHTCKPGARSLGV